jgi:hypothetical protein
MSFSDPRMSVKQSGQSAWPILLLTSLWTCRQRCIYHRAHQVTWSTWQTPCSACTRGPHCAEGELAADPCLGDCCIGSSWQSEMPRSTRRSRSVSGQEVFAQEEERIRTYRLAAVEDVQAAGCTMFPDAPRQSITRKWLRAHPFGAVVVRVGNVWNIGWQMTLIW